MPRARSLTALALLLALAACSGSSGDPDGGACDGGACPAVDAGPPPIPDGGCRATFAGVYSEVDVYPSCCTATQNTPQSPISVSCDFTASTALVHNHFEADLGPAPTTDTVTSSLDSAWSVIAGSYATNMPDCTWTAGPGQGEGGGFSLTVSQWGGDGGLAPIHGTLHLQEATANADPKGLNGCGVTGETLDATF